MGRSCWHPNPGSLSPLLATSLTAASIMHTETMARNSCSQGRRAEQRVWPADSGAEWRLSSIQNEGRTGCQVQCGALPTCLLGEEEALHTAALGHRQQDEQEELKPGGSRRLETLLIHGGQV